MVVRVSNGPSSTVQYGGGNTSPNFWDFDQVASGGSLSDAELRKRLEQLNAPFGVSRGLPDNFWDFNSVAQAQSKGRDISMPDPSTVARSNGPRGVGRSPLPAPRDPTLMDLLAFAMQAMGVGGGGGGSTGPDYSALIAQLRKQAAESDSKVGAMYRQLQDSIAADAPGIAANYQGASQAVGDTADQTSTNIQAAYQAARDEQTRQLAALGIEEAAGVQAAQGNRAGNDMAHALSNVEQNKAINQNQLGQNQATSTNFNTSMAEAAGLQGTETRGDIQRQLQQKLAELQSQQASASSGGGGGGPAASWSSILDLTKMLQDEQDKAHAAQQPTGPALDPQIAIQQMLTLMQQGYDASDAAKIVSGAKGIASLYK